jgi:ATP-binding cassette, subfamily C (CFTR/MRP), member 1
MARAVYSGADFLLFDDPFSRLDPSTEAHVFENLLGRQGMLRTRKATVVIVSSDGWFLLPSLLLSSLHTTNVFAARRVPFADHVVLMDEGGRISYSGTPQDVDPDKVKELEGRVSWTLTGHSRPRDEPEMESGRRRLGVPGELMVADMKFQADAARRLGDSRLYGFYANAVGWLPLAIFVVSMAVFAFCSTFPSAYSSLQIHRFFSIHSWGF